MIGIERYIEKLLLTHDCVIIPEFGGFVAQYEPSYRVEENNAFYPPFRTIGFNEQLTMNDGLLVQAYMQTYDTNYPEALRLVKEASNRIKEALHNDGEYHFNNIGTLKLNSDSKLVFTPESESGIACPQFYGLDVLNISVFDAASSEETTIVENAETSTPTVAAVEQEVEAEDTIEETEEDNSRHYVIRLNRNITNYVAAAIIAICFYFAFSVPVSNSSSTQNIKADMTESALYSFPFLSNIDSKTEVTADASVTAETPQVETENEETPAEAEKMVEESKETSYYTIVLASCIKESNANDYIERLKAHGYDDAHYFVKNGMKRVIYSKYSTENEAFNALQKLTNKDLFEDAWVLHIQ